MTDRPPGSTDQPADRFAWHPQYRGRTLREVAAEIGAEVARDQRAFALAMEGAEEHEQTVLATVVELERKWGGFDLDWATADPAELADRIVAFERARDEARELFPYAQYRARFDPAEPASPTAASRPWWRFWDRG